MLKIGITEPGNLYPGIAEIANEALRITSKLEDGVVDLIHLRKPEWSKDELASLIEQIPTELHSRLKLHDHFSLLNRFDLGGVHLNSRNPVPPANARSVSRSLHSVQELAETCGTCYDYVTLSPIFDSISKSGYESKFPADLSLLSPLLRGKNVVALGGVTPERFAELEKAGFYGAAMLGALWHK